MIHKVAIQIQAQPGVLVTQTFEQIVDDNDTDRTEKFGEESAALAHAFVTGFAEFDDSV
jgi:hypothetical protein